MIREPWRPLARRGEFTMVIVSKARAQLDGLPMDRHTSVVGMVLTEGDEEPGNAICFLSFESAREFVEVMEPTAISFRCAPHEDVGALRLVLDGRRGRLH